MGDVFKKTTTRHVDEHGNRVSSTAPGAQKIREKSKSWYGNVKLANGKWKAIPLFTDKAASRKRLRDVQTGIERGEAGLVNPYGPSLALPIEDHMGAYLNVLTTRGVNEKHFSERSRILYAVLNACSISTLVDLTTDRIDSYLGGMNRSARTKDTHRGAIHAFCEWLVQVKRLPENPVKATAKPNGEIVRRRRAESDDNLRKLLETARKRPLIEAKTVCKGDRRGECYANIRPDVQRELTQLGRERALLYKTAILTGMRAGELKRLQANHLRLEGGNADRPRRPFSQQKEQRRDLVATTSIARERTEFRFRRF